MHSIGPLDHTPLGRLSENPEIYDPALLCPIPRDAGRVMLGLAPGAPLPFWGEDVWNAYEVSWLDPTGKPQIAMLELRFPVDTPFLLESKSMKLYFNSFNMSRFVSPEAVTAVVATDLSRVAGRRVMVAPVSVDRFSAVTVREPAGECLDRLKPNLVGYTVDAAGLVCGDRIVSETWFSRLFRSTCPVTGQPDWGTVSIAYTGRRIDPCGLLGYLISFRRHAGFHENCVERIFMDITGRCHPASLTVAARFVRRGGLDINPVRSSAPVRADNFRDPRQ